MQGRGRWWASAARVVALGLLLAGAVSGPALAYEKEIRSESEVIAAKVAEQGKTKIAVVDFTDLQGHVTELGRFMAEELSIALADSGKGFQVVDRTHLRSIIQEHKLASSGLIDPETAQALGKIAGVDALITGTITPFADSIHLAIKVLDANTADIITSDTVNIPKTQGIQELLSQEIESASGNAGGPAHRTVTNPQKQVKTADHGQFHFELRGCGYDGSTLWCEVVVTNSGGDKRATLKFYGSRIIGRSGREYLPHRVFLGSYEGGIAGASNVLPQGVPMRAGLKVFDVRTAPQEIALLELNWGGFVVEFRQIPVER